MSSGSEALPGLGCSCIWGHQCLSLATGGKLFAFRFTKGLGEMSCQRLHLRLVMKLGVPHRTLELEFSAQTYI